MAVRRSPASTITAIAVHGVIILLFGYLFYRIQTVPPQVKPEANHVQLNPPEIQVPSPGNRGGSGSDSSEASLGKPPEFTRVLVAAVLPMDKPRIAIEPSLPMPDVPHMASAMTDIGLMDGKDGPPSAGYGKKGGIGNGGNDEYGGGPDAIGVPGNGISAPVLLYSVEAEFSEQARKNKFQGTVSVDCVVGTDGRAHAISVPNPVGMGLDQKAMDAVAQYRFQPSISRATGKAVPVRVTVQVIFRIL